MSKATHVEFIQFLVLGGIAATVNFLSRIGFSEIMSYRYAIICAYVAGMIVAFLLFRKFVFSPSDRHYIHEIRDFVIVNLLGIAQVWLISVGLAEYFFPYIGFNFYAEEVAHMIGLGVPAITSYFGHKHFSFR